MSITHYTRALDLAAARVPGGALHIHTDRDAAFAVVLLCGHWMSTNGEWSSDLLLKCGEYMKPSEAMDLAQTLAAIARRGVALSERPEGARP